MAYTTESLLARKRRFLSQLTQQQALGRTVTSGQMEGMTRGILGVEAEREYEMSKLAKDVALRERGLSIQEESVRNQAEAIRSGREIAEKRLGMEEEQMSDQELAGYLETGVSLLGTKAGEKAVGWAGSKLFPSATTAGTAGATMPAVTGAGAAMPSALGTGGVQGFMGAGIPVQGFLGAEPALQTGLATEGATGGILSAAAPFAMPALGGAVGGYIGGEIGRTKLFQELSPFGGRRTESAFGGALGGAAAGTAFMPGIGTVIGGVIGLATGLLGAGKDPVWQTEKQYDELYGKTEKQFKTQYGEEEGGKLYHAWKYGGTYSGSAGTQTFEQGGMKNKEDAEKKKAEKEDGGTVICTELYRQGYITFDKLGLDFEYREKYIDNDTYNGYMKWAPKVVKLMQKSKLVTMIIKPFGIGWINEMAHRIKPSEHKGSIIGKVLLNIGVPLCRWLGKGKEVEVYG